MKIFTYRVRFTKLARMKFLSHHDLMRLFQRIMRRADLPLRFSEGFNPRPLISFPVALAIGVESEDEVMQFELTSWISPRELQEKMNSAFPQGIEILDITEAKRRDKFEVSEVIYEIDPKNSQDILEKIRSIVKSPEIKIERDENKIVDVRPYILDISYSDGKILVRTKVTSSGTVRVDEILKLLDMSIEKNNVTKIKTILAS